MNRPRLLLIFALFIALVACAPTTSAPTSAPATSAPVTSAPATIPPTAAPTAAPTSAPATPAGSASAFPLTITDGANRTVTLGKAPQKIISLAPSTTEMVYALGQGAKLVARDDFSDYPNEVLSLPKVGGMQPNFEQIVAFAPDLVLAAGIQDATTIKKLESLNLSVAVVGSSRTTIDSVLGDIRLVGKMLGVPERAQQVTDDMQRRIDTLKLKAAGARSKPKVYWELDATDVSKPFAAGAGNFINDIISLAAGENVFAAVNAPFPQVGAEQVIGANPDVIILSDAAYGTSPDSVKARNGWGPIAAVKNNRVFAIDDSLVSRPGPRVVDGLEAAMRLIHPELFQ